MGREQHCWNQLSPLTFILRRYYLISTRGVYLLRPRDEHCFCLRPLLRKPQQTDGRYRDLLITDTLTFKAVSLSLCVERNESYTTSCQPHIIRLLQKKKTARNQQSTKKCGPGEGSKPQKDASWKPTFFFYSLIAKRMSMDHISCWLKSCFQWNSHTACPSVMALLPTQSSPTSSLSGSAGPRVCGMLLYVEGEGNCVKTV